MVEILSYLPMNLLLYSLQAMDLVEILSYLPMYLLLYLLQAMDLVENLGGVKAVMLADTSPAK